MSPADCIFSFPVTLVSVCPLAEYECCHGSHLSLCLQILCAPLGHNSPFWKCGRETQGFASLVLVPVFLFPLWVVFHTPGCSLVFTERASTQLRVSLLMPWLPLSDCGRASECLQWLFSDKRHLGFPAFPQCFPKTRRALCTVQNVLWMRRALHLLKRVRLKGIK